MDYKSLSETAVSQVSGNIEKAIIEIIDMRGQKVCKEPPVEAQGGRPVTMFSFGRTAPSRKLFHVQFNPSQLSLSGYGGGMVSKTDYSGKESSITFSKADVKISMEVKLIFDKVNSLDAFMGDKARKLLSAASEAAAGTAKRPKAGTEYSVQTEVEGFMAALRSKYTRRITFYWGAMAYTGILNKVSAQYVMFNVRGQPVRAWVTLSLVCADQSVSPGSMGAWQAHYRKLLEAGNQSYVKGAQRVGNILNFNL